MVNNMAALVFYGPGKYEVEEILRPQSSDNNILLEVSACGLCGSDIRTLKFGHMRVIPPFTFGHEVTGKVVEVGARANTQLKPGDRIAIAPVVYCGVCSYCREERYEYCENYQEFGQTWPGGFAEYMLIPQEALQRGNIHLIPETLDPISATLAEPLGACLHALERMELDTVRSAAIFGAGTIGCLMLQLLRSQSVEKIAIIDPNPNRLELAKKIGADLTINNRTDKVTDEVETLTGKAGVDLTVIATAAPSAFGQAMGIISKGGQIILFAGFPKDQSVLDIDLNVIHYKCLKLTGSSIYAPRHYRRALDMIAEGSIMINEMITTFPLKEFHKGAKSAIEGKVIKAVFIP